ncbi:MAG: DUF3887 domain-containing protein [Chloroflexota bacterium]|jgi:hypothetical protein
MNPKNLFVMLGVALLIVLAGCNLFGGGQVTLEGAERDAVLAYATEMGDNLISGITSRDYSVFSRDFDAVMKDGMDEAAFQNLLVTFDEKLGAYQSHEISSVLQDGDYDMVIYRLAYEKDDLVTMRIVFNREAPHLISGLWFDSPELRKN